MSSLRFRSGSRLNKYHRSHAPLASLASKKTTTLKGNNSVGRGGNIRGESLLCSLHRATAAPLQSPAALSAFAVLSFRSKGLWASLGELSASPPSCPLPIGSSRQLSSLPSLSLALLGRECGRGSRRTNGLYCRLEKESRPPEKITGLGGFRDTFRSRGAGRPDHRRLP